MIKVLLVLQDDFLRHSILLALESAFSVGVVEARTAVEANAAIAATNEPVRLVITSWNELGQKVFFDHTTKPMSWVMLSGYGLPPPPPRADFISLPLTCTPDELRAGVVQLLQDPALLASKTRSPDELRRIKAKLLVAASPLPGDVYIRLSAKKTLKIFSAGDNFDSWDLHRYAGEKRIEYFHVKGADQEAFIQRIFQSSSTAPIAEVPSRPAAPRPAVAPSKPSIFTQSILASIRKDPAAVMDALAEINKCTQFDGAVQEVIKECVRVTVDSIRKSNRLKDLFEDLDRNPDKYVASHSKLLAHLSCMIASQMAWKSSATFQKLTLAAMLHDITIKNQKLAAIKTLDELKVRQREFTEEERELFKDHPIEVAELVRTMSDVPPDVDAILLEHHERCDGRGFPRGLPQSRIGALSVVFIVAHDLADFILSEKENAGSATGASIKAFCEKHQKTYNQGSFKKALTVVAKMAK